MENKAKFFMHAYMYELERFLDTQKEEISKVSLWLDEANADRELKVYFKKLIESVFNKIPSDTDIKGVVIESIGKCDIVHLQNIFITRVLLPEDIGDQIKGALGRSKGRVYTNPDICLEISIDDKLHYEPVELKTTKEDAIPGSSIQQVTPDEWVMFVRFSERGVDIATGQYINAMNSNM